MNGQTKPTKTIHSRGLCQQQQQQHYTGSPHPHLLRSSIVIQPLLRRCHRNGNDIYMDFITGVNELNFGSFLQKVGNCSIVISSSPLPTRLLWIKIKEAFYEQEIKRSSTLSNNSGTTQMVKLYAGKVFPESEKLWGKLHSNWKWD